METRSLSGGAPGWPIVRNDLDSGGRRGCFGPASGVQCPVPAPMDREGTPAQNRGRPEGGKAGPDPGTAQIDSRRLETGVVPRPAVHPFRQFPFGSAG